MASFTDRDLDGVMRWDLGSRISDLGRAQAESYLRVNAIDVKWGSTELRPDIDV